MQGSNMEGAKGNSSFSLGKQSQTNATNLTPNSIPKFRDDRGMINAKMTNQ